MSRASGIQSPFWETYNARAAGKPNSTLELPLAPYETYLNLIRLADAALDIVAATTLILKDWDTLPNAKDISPMRAIWNWRYNRNDYDPFGVGTPDEENQTTQ